MKASKIFNLALISLAMLQATSAFAANKGSLQVDSPTNVAGKQLTAGDYTVRWEGAGPSVDVKIMQGNKVLATVPAKLIILDSASSYDAAVVNNNGDGSRSLSQIRFSGKKFALEIGGESSAAASKGGMRADNSN